MATQNSCGRFHIVIHNIDEQHEVLYLGYPQPGGLQRGMDETGCGKQYEGG